VPNALAIPIRPLGDAGLDCPVRCWPDAEPAHVTRHFHQPPGTWGGWVYLDMHGQETEGMGPMSGSCNPSSAASYSGRLLMLAFRQAGIFPDVDTHRDRGAWMRWNPANPGLVARRA